MSHFSSDEGCMKREEQYRYGLFVQADPIPQWVRDGVAEAKAQAPHAPRDVIKESETLIGKLHHNALNRLKALEFLGWSEDRGLDGLLQHTQRLADTDSTLAADYWTAMWTIRHGFEDEQQLEQILPAYADALEEVQVQAELGWPAEWPKSMCAIWTAADGTPSTARAWAKAGWDAEEVLTYDLKLNGRNLSLRERVTALRPPIHDTNHFESAHITQCMCAPTSASRGNR